MDAYGVGAPAYVLVGVGEGPSAGADRSAILGAAETMNGADMAAMRMLDFMVEATTAFTRNSAFGKRVFLKRKRRFGGNSC